MCTYTNMCIYIYTYMLWTNRHRYYLCTAVPGMGPLQFGIPVPEEPNFLASGLVRDDIRVVVVDPKKSIKTSMKTWEKTTILTRFLMIFYSFMSHIIIQHPWQNIHFLHPFFAGFRPAEEKMIGIQVTTAPPVGPAKTTMLPQASRRPFWTSPWGDVEKSQRNLSGFLVVKPR